MSSSSGSPARFRRLRLSLEEGPGPEHSRSFPLLHQDEGEVHHPLRYNIKRRLAVVGALPAPDAETERIFHGLVARNAINMHARATSLVLYGNAENGRWEDRLDSLAAAKEA